MSAIQIVLFDLGSTILYTKDPWPPILQEADRALAAVLQEAGLPLDCEQFVAEFDSFLDAYYAERGNGAVEKTTFSALQELLKKKGFPNVDGSTVRTALDAMYAVTLQNWYLEEDALPTLEALRQSGYRLGLVSNASDDKNVQQLVNRHGLRPYFEYIVTSAGCGIRKPEARIFQMALDHFRVRPEAAVMVGDTLEADILGANRLGIYSIWITRRTEVREEGELAIQPQAVVSALTQIPSLLAELESELGLV